MHALRVTEANLTSENAFIVDLLALRSEKESKYDKITFFLGSFGALELSEILRT